MFQPLSYWKILIALLMLVPGFFLCGCTDGPNNQNLFDDPNYFGKNAPPVTGELIFKTIGALFIVLALCVCILVVSKRIFPRLNRVTGKSIQIQETAMLGPRKYLHIVEVSNQRLLLGSTNDRITMLAHLIDDLSAIDIESSPESEVS
jgi:flagellar biosynthetic protein FliO